MQLALQYVWGLVGGGGRGSSAPPPLPPPPLPPPPSTEPKRQEGAADDLVSLERRVCDAVQRVYEARGNDLARTRRYTAATAKKDRHPRSPERGTYLQKKRGNKDSKKKQKNKKKKKERR